MNMLFFTDSDVYALRGGIDRVVGVLSNSLIKQDGYKCFLAYFDKTPNEQVAPFEKRVQIDKENFLTQFSDFIAKNNIDKIVVSAANKQNIKFLLPQIKQINKNIPLYFWFHSTPAFELSPLNFKVAVYRIFHNKNKISNLKKMLFSVFPKKIGILFLRKKYAFVYNYADKIVLLSKHYVNNYAACVGKINEKKITAIGNSLSFEVFADEKNITEKEKIVLIVARIDEDSKRISLALKIWQQIEQQDLFLDWKLIIVGSGIDEDYCRRLAKKMRLKNCIFEGQQNSLDYYRRASIFMMTSSNEGFPMTLGEAQQMGVVPIAFDSFGAVHDIIENDFNGIIVPKNNHKEFVNQLVELMQNTEKRQTLAKNALESCKQFSIENIVKKWKTF